MRHSQLVRPVVAVVLSLAIILAGSSRVSAHQEAPGGVWIGSMQVADQVLEIIVTLQPLVAGGFSGMIDIPAQQLTAYPLTEIAVAADAITFAMQGIPGNPVFTGTWDADAETIAGDLEQAGQAFPFELRRTAEAPPSSVTHIDPALAAQVAGDWAGTISAGAQTLRLVFHIEADGGALMATMDSPDQGQTGMPVNKVAFDGTTLRADLTYAGAYFEGTMSSDATAFDGSWNQGGGAVPLRLEKQ